MNPINEVTVLVVGHGLDIPIAQRLARDCKRVLYFSEWCEGFSKVEKGIVGDGIPGIERVMDIWDVKDTVDLFVFPDLGYRGLQMELESQGFPVWGARGGEKLELNREYFLRVLKEVGLELPPVQVCVGITKLRECLRDKENVYIKISLYRGSMETTHFRSWKLDENLIDHLAVKFGGAREMMRFLVCDHIDTELELGCDTYNIDGEWPETVLSGVEYKYKAYFSAVTPFLEMPEQLRNVMARFEDILGRKRYRCQWSMEVRIKDDRSYFIDPTTRLGMPSTASQIELWKNYSEIIWQGANGVMVQPEPVAQFSAELVLKAKSGIGLWATAEVPEELKQWVKLSGHCQVEGVDCFPPDENEDRAVGWLVAIGDTPEQVIEQLKFFVEHLPDGLSADIAPLAGVLKEIDEAEEQGIGFTEKPMPEPAAVVE
jgi:hypothetical protein